MRAPDDELQLADQKRKKLLMLSATITAKAKATENITRLHKEYDLRLQEARASSFVRDAEDVLQEKSTTRYVLRVKGCMDLFYIACYFYLTAFFLIPFGRHDGNIKRLQLGLVS
jgi:hypothetical protein